MRVSCNCPGTPAKRGLQAVLSQKNIFDARKVAHSPPYRGVPGHARGGTWAVTSRLNKTHHEQAAGGCVAWSPKKLTSLRVQLQIEPKAGKPPVPAPYIKADCGSNQVHGG